MQFSIRQLLMLTAIVALMFGRLGRYWPLGTAVAVVVCVGAGVALLAFGNVKSWKIVVWVAAVFLGSLISIRYALLFDSWAAWEIRAIEACVLLAGAFVSGAAAFLMLWLTPKFGVFRRRLGDGPPTADVATGEGMGREGLRG